MKTLRGSLCLLCLLVAALGYGQDDWTRKYTDPAPLPRMSAHAMASVGGDKVVMFGGNVYQTILNDTTWIYDLGTNTWTRQYPASTPTPQRYRHAMAYAGDDKALMFGGNRNGMGISDETWVYDLSDNAWTLKNPPTSPAGRRDHKMAYVGGGKVVLFGGSADNGEYFEDTWVYDLGSNTWTNMNPATHPSGRQAYAMASIGDDKAVLFGGWISVAEVSGETWVYDLSENKWTLESPARHPAARYSHVMASLGGSRALLFGGDSVIVFNGKENVTGWTNDTWIYDVAANTWTPITPATSPVPQDQGAMAPIGERQTLMFGGSDYDPNVGRTWVFTASPTPSEQTGDLLALVAGLGLPPNVASSLQGKLKVIQQLINQGNTTSACQLLEAFVNEVNAMTGKSLTPDQAQQLIDAANQIITALGCSTHPALARDGDREPASPVAYSLLQNFPNPFNPETRVGYSLPEAVHTRLLVFDLLGRLVRVLVDDVQPPGVHMAVWDGRDQNGMPAASGVYFYRLSAGRFTELKSMILMR